MTRFLPGILAGIALSGLSQAQSAPVKLEFSKLFAPTRMALEPTPYLKSLIGKRVEIVGHMVRFDNHSHENETEAEHAAHEHEDDHSSGPISGGFYIHSFKVFCDESGGGAGDLPPNAVFVEIKSLKGKSVPFVPGLVRVTGTLQMSQKVHPTGYNQSLRLILDTEKNLTPQEKKDLALFRKKLATLGQPTTPAKAAPTKQKPAKKTGK